MTKARALKQIGWMAQDTDPAAADRYLAQAREAEVDGSAAEPGWQIRPMGGRLVLVDPSGGHVGDVANEAN